MHCIVDPESLGNVQYCCGNYTTVISYGITKIQVYVNNSTDRGTHDGAECG